MKHKGFTLIELLVAISIIAVISTIGFTTYQGTQAKARDNVRKSDLTQLATALEAYFQKNKSYVMTDSQQCNSTNSNKLYDAIDDYMTNNQVPGDPQGSRYCYFSENSGDSFRLFAKLENCSDPQIIPGINCATSSYNYSLTSDDLLIAAAPTAGSTPPTSPSPSPPPASPSPSPSPPPSTAQKRVFVTSTTYTGDLGGLTGADAKCQARANDPNNDGNTTDSLGGTWKAWLSIDDAQSPSTRFTRTNGNYIRLDNVVVANGWDDLTDGTIDNHINVNENNQPVPPSNVWTNTYQGIPDPGRSGHCNNWGIFSSSDKGLFGTFPSSLDVGWWTDFALADCSQSHRLYCFEQ